MPPIESRKDYKVNIQAEQAFYEDEKESSDKMNKVYQELKLGERII